MTPDHDDSGLWQLWARKLAEDLSELWTRENDTVQLLTLTVPMLQEVRTRLAGAVLLDGPRPDDRLLAEFHEVLDAALLPGETLVEGRAGSEFGETLLAWMSAILALTGWLRFLVRPGPPGSDRLQ